MMANVSTDLSGLYTKVSQLSVQVQELDAILTQEWDVLNTNVGRYGQKIEQLKAKTQCSQRYCASTSSKSAPIANSSSSDTLRPATFTSEAEKCSISHELSRSTLQHQDHDECTSSLTAAQVSAGSTISKNDTNPARNETGREDGQHEKHEIDQKSIPSGSHTHEVQDRSCVTTCDEQGIIGEKKKLSNAYTIVRYKLLFLYFPSRVLICCSRHIGFGYAMA